MPCCGYFGSDEENVANPFWIACHTWGFAEKNQIAKPKMIRQPKPEEPLLVEFDAADVEECRAVLTRSETAL